MNKMLKVFAIALLAVSLMASMVLNVSAEEAVEAFAEIIEETPALAEEESVAEEPVVEDTAEGATIEEEVAEEAVEAQERKVSFTFSWDGDEVEYGDEIKLVPVLSGYEGVDYELVWQYSTDNANWNDYATGDASYIITEENVSWYWRLVVNTVEEQAA